MTLLKVVHFILTACLFFRDHLRSKMFIVRKRASSDVKHPYVIRTFYDVWHVIKHEGNDSLIHRLELKEITFICWHHIASKAKYWPTSVDMFRSSMCWKSLVFFWSFWEFKLKNEWKDEQISIKKHWMSKWYSVIWYLRQQKKLVIPFFFKAARLLLASEGNASHTMIAGTKNRRESINDCLGRSIES